MPTAVALMQCTGVFSCGWPRSGNDCQKIIPVWKLWKSAPSSASAADVTANLIKLELVWSEPFNYIGSPSLGIQPMKKCPQARLCAPFLKRYDVLECIFIIMSDAWNLTLPPDCLLGNPVIAYTAPLLSPLPLSAQLQSC